MQRLFNVLRFFNRAIVEELLKIYTVATLNLIALFVYVIEFPGNLYLFNKFGLYIFALSP